MNIQDVMAELESLGTEQNRKVYANHGGTGPMFGVSFANLNKMKKNIKKDFSLIKELWATENADARSLAILSADPKLFNEDLLDLWAKDMDGNCVSDMFAGLVAKTEFSEKKFNLWSTSSKDFLAATGWSLMAHMAMNDETHDNAYYLDILNTIETTIHDSTNRTRYAKNGALIAIGIRNDELKQAACAAAKRIGKVIVDHGKTSCKTPDAIPYIEKTWKRKKAKAAKLLV